MMRTSSADAISYAPEIGVRTDEPIYFDSGSRQLAGWLHQPGGERTSSTGLVICKPFGYESLCGHRSIKAFADMAAGLGMPVLRFDYLGTGDSQDIDPNADQIEAWVGDVQAAVAQMRVRTGVTRVCLMGIRLGAMLAALAVARGAAVSDLILMAPVVSGRRYLRELRTTRLVAAAGVEGVEATAAPATVDGASPDSAGSSEFSGYDMSAATMATLTRQELSASLLPRFIRLLILDRSDFPTARSLRDQLTPIGVNVNYTALPGFVEMAMVAPHYAMPPREMLAAAQQWLTRTPGVPARAAQEAPAATAVLASSDSTLKLPSAQNDAAASERAVSIGIRTPLFGIVTEPPPGELRRRAVILLNVGVDYHIGPSRMYVDLARRWAQRGYYVLRLDLPGVGDSPVMAGGAENIVYQSQAVEDVAAAVEFMRSRYGILDLTLSGVCAGAYHALRATAAGLKVERLLLVNPQVYFWKEGMSLDGLTQAEVVRNPEVYRRRLFSPAAWRRVFAGQVDLGRIFKIYLRRPLMSLESTARDWSRVLGIRLKDDLGRDLEGIIERGVQLVFAFSPHEPGLPLLRLQAGAALRRLGEKCRIRNLPCGDHTFSQHGPRRLLEDVLSEELFARRDAAAAR